MLQVLFLTIPGSVQAQKVMRLAPMMDGNGMPLQKVMGIVLRPGDRGALQAPKDCENRPHPGET